MEKEKRGIGIIGKLWQPLLAFFALFVLVMGAISSNQEYPNQVTSFSFVGNYKIDDGEYQPYSKNSLLHGTSVVLEGRFEDDKGIVNITKDTEMYFYLEHMSLSIYINDELAFKASSDQLKKDHSISEICGRDYVVWETPVIQEDDQIRLEMVSLHGSIQSYSFQKMLTHMYYGEETAFKYQLTKENVLEWGIGFLICTASLLLFGIGAAYRKENPTLAKKLFHWAAFSLFAGLYTVFTTLDFTYRFNFLSVSTFGERISLMLAALELLCCTSDYLTGKRKKTSIVSIMILAYAVIGIMCAVLLSILRIYDTWMVFYPLIMIISVMMLICMLLEKPKRREQILFLCIYASIYLAILVEGVNLFFGKFDYGYVVEIVFIIAFITSLFVAVHGLIHKEQELKKTKELEEELKNSRVSLAMSQIRSHFIFNVLNAVSGMCKYDAKKADETIVCFSRYLRNNIDILENDQPIPISVELQHIQDYVTLEQVRFGPRIQFTYHINTPDFLFPPMLLQPLVENAIKHGLLPKEEGGMIQIETTKEENHYIIIIEDNGVGFDTNASLRNGAVGLNNVRFRVEKKAHGTMNISSTQGKGTRIEILIPIE